MCMIDPRKATAAFSSLVHGPRNGTAATVHPRRVYTRFAGGVPRIAARSRTSERRRWSDCSASDGTDAVIPTLRGGPLMRGAPGGSHSPTASILWTLPRGGDEGGGWLTATAGSDTTPRVERASNSRLAHVEGRGASKAWRAGEDSNLQPSDPKSSYDSMLTVLFRVA